MKLPTLGALRSPIKMLGTAARTATAMATAFTAEVASGIIFPRTYHGIDALVGMIEGENGARCKKLLEDNRKLFSTAPGSGHNHQAWPGGYRDHVVEAMNLALVLHRALSFLRPLPFTASDALFVLFLHDLEKPWRYEFTAEGVLKKKPGMDDKKARRRVRDERFEEYGIVFTEDQDNAMRYVEGEMDDYSPHRRIMGLLAAFCHCCDVISARIWHDYPLKKKDPWTGAGRDRT